MLSRDVLHNKVETNFFIIHAKYLDMKPPNSITSSELGTPLSFSFTNFNSLTHNLKKKNITKPTFSPFNLERDIDKVLHSLKRQYEEEYVKLNEVSVNLAENAQK